MSSTERRLELEVVLIPHGRLIFGMSINRALLVVILLMIASAIQPMLPTSKNGRFDLANVPIGNGPNRKNDSYRYTVRLAFPLGSSEEKAMQMLRKEGFTIARIGEPKTDRVYDYEATRKDQLLRCDRTWTVIWSSYREEIQFVTGQYDERCKTSQW